MKDANGKEEIIKVMLSLDRSNGVPLLREMPVVSGVSPKATIQVFFWRCEHLNGRAPSYPISKLAIENGKDDVLFEIYKAPYDADKYELKSGHVYNAKLEADNTLTLILF